MGVAQLLQGAMSTPVGNLLEGTGDALAGMLVDFNSSVAAHVGWDRMHGDLRCIDDKLASLPNLYIINATITAIAVSVERVHSHLLGFPQEMNVITAKKVAIVIATKPLQVEVDNAYHAQVIAISDIDLLVADVTAINTMLTNVNDPTTGAAAVSADLLSLSANFPTAGGLVPATAVTGINSLLARTWDTTPSDAAYLTFKNTDYPAVVSAYAALPDLTTTATRMQALLDAIVNVRTAPNKLAGLATHVDVLRAHLADMPAVSALEGGIAGLQGAMFRDPEISRMKNYLTSLKVPRRERAVA